MAIDSIKITRVCSQLILYNYIDIQVFLEFINFDYRFIYSFSNIAYSLFNVTSTNITWIQSLDQQYTFTTLKIVITTTLVLDLPNISVLFRIKVDSLDFAIEVVLSQQSKEDNKQYSIELFNQLLSIVKCNYKIHDKKILVVI